MKALPHAFRTTFRRFRWEIFAFWLYSAALSFGLIGAKLGAADLDHGPGPAPSHGSIEVLSAIWITARLMFSEPALMTQGGWRTRPFGRGVSFLAPFAVMAAVLLPAALLRILPAQAAASPDIAGWGRILLDTVLPGLGILLGLALLMRGAGSLLPRRNPGWGKKIAFGVLCLVALAGSYTGLSRMRTQAYGNWYSGDGDRAYPRQILGIQKLLEPGGTYVGDWTTITPPAPAMKVLYRMPLKEGLTANAPGIRAEITGVKTEKNQLEVKMKLTTAGKGLYRDASVAAPVLRYVGNVYAFCRKESRWAPPQLLQMDPVRKMETVQLYDSPVGESWNRRSWDELLADAELIFFSFDPDGAPIPTIDGLVKPQREQRTIAPGLAGQVEDIFNTLDFVHYPPDYEAKRERAAQAAKTLPAEAMPHILAQRVWSRLNWDLVVKPFLLEHAAEADKPVLLERMTREPRLGEIFLAKGWRAEAMPPMKAALKDRLPLELAVIKGLAEEKDPALAADLVAVAARLPEGAETVETLLRAYPGFDWQRFVHEGWTNRKYRDRWLGEMGQFDLWAAQEGDIGAFQYVAEKAARRQGGYDERLRSLVTGQPQDAVGYVRANLGKMRYDAGTKTWSGGP